MRQEFPDPVELRWLVDHLAYKSGFAFRLYDDYHRGQACVGLTLVIQVRGPNSYDPAEADITVNHLFPVPAAAYDLRSWRRWLFERIADVDLHERCEWFEIDGTKVFAPSHGPGSDPYLLREAATDADVKTSSRGEHLPDAGKAPRRRRIRLVD